MGEFAQLNIGKTVIIEEKNELCLDYSDIFPINSISTIPYYYAYNIVEYKKGYRAKLKTISLRLSIMGYTIVAAKEQIRKVIIEWNRENYKKHIGFEEFYDLILKTKLNSWNSLISLMKVQDLEELYYSIEPRYILQVLAQNDDNLSQDVTWGLIDVIEGGYVSYEKVIGSRAKNKVLIATEGKTDKGILSQSLTQLFPEFFDLFYFFNYSGDESVNVSGCQDLYRFCKYISQMDHSYVIALFDNDVDGIHALKKAKSIDNTNNLLITRLPDRKEFEHFEIVNPWGNDTYENINGKSVAIENFLDFRSIKERPIIKKENLNGQGKLCFKEKYQKAFNKAASNELLRTNKYNTNKIEELILELVGQWIDYLNDSKKE